MSQVLLAYNNFVLLLGNKNLSLFKTPYVKVLRNVWQLLNVSSYGEMSVQDECCQEKTISRKVLQAGLEPHILHGRAAPSLISLLINVKINMNNDVPEY